MVVVGTPRIKAEMQKERRDDKNHGQKENQKAGDCSSGIWSPGFGALSAQWSFASAYFCSSVLLSSVLLLFGPFARTFCWTVAAAALTANSLATADGDSMASVDTVVFLSFFFFLLRVDTTTKLVNGGD